MFSGFRWLTIGLFLIWCVISQRWYVCHINQACEGSSKVVQPSVDSDGLTSADGAENSDPRPITFKFGDATAQLQNSFQSFKQSTIEALPKGQLLEIVGLHFPGEVAPAGFANLGLARAAQIKELFVPPLSADRVVVSSKLEEASGEENSDGLIEAVLFKVRDSAAPDDIEVVTTDNAISILFPHASVNWESNSQIDAALDQLVDRLSKSGESLLITGHTDNTGTAQQNLAMGLKRATRIKELLQNKGLDNARIRVYSEGQEKPVADNDTEEGKRQNRRVELQIAPE